jgi:hypothetical protein
MMRAVLTVLLISGMALGQAAEAPKADNPGSNTTPVVTASSAPGAPSSVVDPNIVTIPAGTKIPLSLKQAISTKNAREGDAVYAETAFPFVVNACGARRADEGAGRDIDPLYFHDLSQRIYRDAAGIGGEYARRG